MLTVSVWVLDGKILSAFLDTPDGKTHVWHTGEEWPKFGAECGHGVWEVRFIR